jgi:hypothetical protein
VLPEDSDPSLMVKIQRMLAGEPTSNWETTLYLMNLRALSPQRETITHNYVITEIIGT